MIIFASEDVGLADPTSLLVAVAAAQAVEHVGLPEAQLNLSQAAIHLATAPKSNRAALAIWNVRADIRNGSVGEVPAHLRDAHYRGPPNWVMASATDTLMTRNPAGSISSIFLKHWSTGSGTNRATTAVSARWSGE